MKSSLYWMACSNISMYWKPQLSCISSQQACIALLSGSLCKKELIRSLFLREGCRVQHETCRTNYFSYGEGPLKVALRRRMFFFFSWLNENGSDFSEFTGPRVAAWRQNHFHVSSGIQRPYWTDSSPYRKHEIKSRWPTDGVSSLLSLRYTCTVLLSGYSSVLAS